MQCASKHEFPKPFQPQYLVVDHVVSNSSYRSTLSISVHSELWIKNRKNDKIPCFSYLSGYTIYCGEGVWHETGYFSIPNRSKVTVYDHFCRFIIYGCKNGQYPFNMDVRFHPKAAFFNTGCLIKRNADLRP